MKGVYLPADILLEDYIGRWKSSSETSSRVSQIC